MNEAQAKRAFAYIREHGGGTFDPADNYRPYTGDKGYVVGGALGRDGRQIPAHIAASVTEIRTFASWYAAELHRDTYSATQEQGLRRLMVGGWLQDGRIVLDLVEVILSFREAVDAARDRGELAIWDLANAFEIPISQHPIVEGIG